LNQNEDSASVLFRAVSLVEPHRFTGSRRCTGSACRRDLAAFTDGDRPGVDDRDSGIYRRDRLGADVLAEGARPAGAAQTSLQVGATKGRACRSIVLAVSASAAGVNLSSGTEHFSRNINGDCEG